MFRFPNTLETPRNEADKFPRPAQTQAQRYKSALGHSVTKHDSCTFHLAIVLAFELSPFTRVKSERKEKRKR